MTFNLKIGADPEVFVSKDGEFQSGYNLIKGTKEEPYPVKDGAVQVDGMALEFNINPSETSEIFVKNINSVLSQLEGMVEGYELRFTPTAEFSKRIMSSQPAIALALGCEPDFNAWKKEVNPRPEAEDFRTAAGHVHLGWCEKASVDITSQHGEDAFSVARQLDFFLGLPSLIFDRDQKRRDLYGRAGACRVKPYGVEYRVLSNVWLKSDKWKEAIFNNAKEAFDRLVKGEKLEDKFGNIEDVINNNDYSKAINIMTEGGIKYASFL